MSATFEHPDADLIAACEEYLRIQRAFSAHCALDNEDIADGDPAVAMLDQLPPLTERIVALRATTAEGVFARSKCLAYWFLLSYSATRDDPKLCQSERFYAALLRDLTRLERGDGA